MSTTYHPFKIALTDGQKKKLQKAYVSKTAVNRKVKPDQIGRGDELLLTETKIKRLKERSAEGKGMVIKLSKTQIQNTTQRGGNLFSAMLGLAKPLIKPALGALASAGLRPREIELYKLVQRMTPAQKKAAKQYLVGKGLVKGGGAQYGGFLGMLASIGVPLALDLVRKIIGKGMQTQPPPPPPPRTRRSPGIPKGKGMQIQAPPFYGTWEDYYRLKKTEI